MGCSGIFVTGDTGGSAAQSLIPVPVHREYTESSTFAKTEDHLSVFAVYRGGATRKVPLDETEVTLENTVLNGDTPHAFLGPGEKEVVVSYGNLSARYVIVVGNGSGSPSTGGTSVGIEITW